VTCSRVLELLKLRSSPPPLLHSCGGNMVMVVHVRYDADGTVVAVVVAVCEAACSAMVLIVVVVVGGDIVVDGVVA
jgi:hypothetical protein